MVALGTACCMNQALDFISFQLKPSAWHLIRVIWLAKQVRNSSEWINRKMQTWVARNPTTSIIITIALWNPQGASFTSKNDWNHLTGRDYPKQSLIYKPQVLHRRASLKWHTPGFAVIGLSTCIAFGTEVIYVMGPVSSYHHPLLFLSWITLDDLCRSQIIPYASPLTSST